MSALALFAFRAAGSVQNYYVIDTHKRVRIEGETDRVQLGIAAADIRVLDPGNWLFTLPVANP